MFSYSQYHPQSQNSDPYSATADTSYSDVSGYHRQYGNWQQPADIHAAPQAPFLDPRHTDTKDSTRQDAQTEIGGYQNWPQTPQPLKRFTAGTIFSIFGDVILLCVWLGLLGFAVAIARSNGENEFDIIFSDSVLSQARIIVPTLFPIFFAATVGRSLKLASMYRVEQGERLEVLDRLLGSTTFIGTLVTAFTMISASVISLILVLLWALSPLGGQAAFRSFYWRANMTETPTSFTYPSSNNTYNMPGFDSARTIRIGRVNNVFGGAIVSSQTNTDSPMDLWGNVKIPSIEALAKKNTADEEGWYDARKNDTTSYSSLVGVPVQRGATVDSFSRFSLETSYWTLQCPMIGVGSLSKVMPNYKEMFLELPENYTSNIGLQIWTNRRDGVRLEKDSPTLAPRRIVFNMGWYDHLIADCLIQTTYVETEVTCRKRSCAASRVRRSLKSHPSPNYTFLDEEFITGDSRPYFAGLIQGIPARTNAPSSLTTYISRMLGVEKSVHDVGLASEIKDQLEEKMRNTVKDKSGDVALLLSQVLNSYWNAGTVTEYVLDAENGNYSSGVQSKQSIFTFINFETASAAVWSEEPIFHLLTPLAGLLFVAVFVPLMACLVNLALEAFFIQGAPLSMNFSTLTRDNKYIPIPPFASALSDSDRGQLLKNVRLIYGDVAGEREVGHAAVGMVGDVSGRVIMKLDRQHNRLFD